MKNLEYYKRFPVVVIYHGNCADGFGAALAVKTTLGIENVEYHTGVYQQDPPDVKGKHVIMVDFSYKPDVVNKMHDDAMSILILDHHISAQKSFIDSEIPECKLVDMSNWTGDINADRFFENLMLDECENCPYRIYTYFDMDRSGAMIAWEFFNKEPAPDLFHHIQDRDLWKFELDGTREIQAAIFSNPYEFDVWEKLIGADLQSLRAEGKAIERKHFKDLNELLAICQREMLIDGISVPAASLPYTMSSDAGHQMSVGKPFAACYWDTPTTRVFSLRSHDDGADVSQIAVKYGGGGHKNAAGFSVPRDHELAKS